jgi:F0F1-type ATP synthase membrane subunit b/b'
LEEFDDKLNGARSKAKNEVDKVRGEAQAAGNERLAEIRKEVEAYKAENLGSIRDEFVKAGQELKGQVDAFAGEIAGKIVGRAI